MRWIPERYLTVYSTTTSVTSGTNPTVFGQSTTFTATVAAVAPGAGTPTGTVTFLDGATSLGTSTLDGSGQATLSTSALSVGAHTITVSYGGDTNFASSTSSALTQTVNQAGTTTSLALSASTITAGNSVTFTATVAAVAPGAGTPTGTVTFLDGATTVGTPQTLDGSGVATLSTSALAAGTHSITAVYAGDANFVTSTSAASTLTVSAVVVSSGGGGDETVAPAPTATPQPTATPLPTSTPQATAAPTIAVPPTAAPPSKVSLQVGAATPVAVQVPGAGESVAVGLPLAQGRAAAVLVPRAAVDLLPDDVRLVVKHQPTPEVPNLVLAGSLGGGIAQRVAPPIDVKITAEQISTGRELAVPEPIRPQEVFVALPVLAGGTGGSPAGTSLPQGQFTWLMEVREDGEFMGYLRLEATFDAGSNALVYRVPISLLEGTLFLPVVLQPAWVANHDPEVHIWSSPFKSAVDFGVAAEPWTVFEVLAPQVGGRVLVFNPMTQNYGWLDVEGVGPAAGP